MKKVFVFFVLILMSISFYGQRFQDTIPFRNDLGLIIIPISFNGEVKQFAFDTGAERTISYQWAKEELSPTKKKLTVVSSSGRRTKMRFYKSGTIELGSRKIRGHQILNTPQNEIFSCYQIDGILGVDIIKALNWKIDYKNQYLIMYPKNFLPEETNQMHALDFSFRDNRPYVFMKRKQSRFQFLLDTGAGGHSNISKKDYNLVGLEELPQLQVYTGSFDVNGIFTSTSPQVFQFPESSSDDVILQPIIYYNDVKSSKMGNKLWKNHSLYLSLENEQLFVSSKTIMENYEAYPCALGIKDGKMVVIKIHKGTDAWNLGLRQGDEVTAFNGETFTDFCTLLQEQKRMQRASLPVVLTLSNGKTITLKKERFL